jgi:hypothetical protein
MIDCDAHRRYVASFRDFFYVCRQITSEPVPLKDLFTNPGLEHLRGQPGDVPFVLLSQPVRYLSVAVPANSPMSKRLEPLTVADIALTSRDAFVANMTSGAPVASRPALAEKAGKIWEKAVAAKRLADGL